jgi:hypothetical protein
MGRRHCPGAPHFPTENIGADSIELTAEELKKLDAINTNGNVQGHAAPAEGLRVTVRLRAWPGPGRTRNTLRSCRSTAIREVRAQSSD